MVICKVYRLQTRNRNANGSDIFHGHLCLFFTFNIVGCTCRIYVTCIYPALKYTWTQTQHNTGITDMFTRHLAYRHDDKRLPNPRTKIWNWTTNAEHKTTAQQQLEVDCGKWSVTYSCTEMEICSSSPPAYVGLLLRNWYVNLCVEKIKTSYIWPDVLIGKTWLNESWENVRTAQVLILRLQ